VFVAGTFNDWNPSAQAMMKSPNGEWAAELRLAPGRYEYKFFVDGVWCCEPHLRNEACAGDEGAPNAFGTMNRVLLVR
jgi:1,4-alpha-glucan branching enzyme